MVQTSHLHYTMLSSHSRKRIYSLPIFRFLIRGKRHPIRVMKMEVLCDVGSVGLVSRVLMTRYLNSPCPYIYAYISCSVRQSNIIYPAKDSENL